MRNEVTRAFEVGQRIDEVDDLDTLTKDVARVLEPFGVTSVSTNLIMKPGHLLRPGMLFGRRWSDWSQRYRREGFGDADPAVRMLRNQLRPFTWSEARSCFASIEAERVMDACAETTGCREGLVIPVRDSDNTLLSALFSGLQIDFAPDARAVMHLLGHAYAARGRELLHGVILQPKCPLTACQVECLQWVLTGKGDAEIGLITGRAERTVHHLIEQVLTRMDLKRRSVAAHQAWRRGWLA